MRQLGFRTLSAIGCALITTAAFALAAKPITLQLKLPKKPVEPPPAMAGPLTRGPLSLSVTDARGAEDDLLVGEALDDGAPVYVWRASRPVVPAVTEFVTQILAGWSIPLAPEAAFGLRFEIAKYFLTEHSETFGSTYVAEVHLKASFVDKGGRVLWAGDATGDASRPGVDGRASMGNEALSLALRNALISALKAVNPEAEAPATATVEPEALFSDLHRLKAGGVADDVLVSYVEQRKLSRPLTVDEILQWKNAGIPDAAIKAASKGP